MRIAYIAPYQGPQLQHSRPTLRNLSLAGNTKIELIADLLTRSGHDVEIISQGEVVENQFRFFRAFSETKSFNARVPVFYASTLPVPRLNALWSSWRTRALFHSRHKVAPFDLVIVYNLKPPQVLCGSHALRRLALPVVLEYEDDAFVDVSGRQENSGSSWYRDSARRFLSVVSGCLAVSPYLLSRVPESIPKLLLRGVVSERYRDIGSRAIGSRRNWVAFSGTHSPNKGLASLIEAWKLASLPGWELHISGHGSETAALKQQAAACSTIVFRGLLSREEHDEFLRSVKIGINPHDLSVTPGNVFAFKIIEYLAAGNHVLTTPMGPLEADLETGLTYMPDNRPETIAGTLTRVIQERLYERTAADGANSKYGPVGASQALEELLRQVANVKPAKGRVEPTGRLVSNGSVTRGPRNVLIDRNPSK